MAKNKNNTHLLSVSPHITIQPSNKLRVRLDDMDVIEPLTENQRRFFDLYDQGNEFIGLFGSAGTGKTKIAIFKGLEEVLGKDNFYKQLVIVRSLVQTRDIGYLPGDIEEKQEIYELPYKQIFESLFGRTDAYQRLKEQLVVKFISTTAIRGITIEDSIIIVDEAANCNWSELSAIITRIGPRSKLILCGDIFQNDLKNRNEYSGLLKFIEVSNCIREFKKVQFTSEDIVRSNLVKQFIIACEQKGYSLT
jgi:phosphate starvation-inducible protein PhoH